MGMTEQRVGPHRGVQMEDGIYHLRNNPKNPIRKYRKDTHRRLQTLKYKHKGYSKQVKMTTNIYNGCAYTVEKVMMGENT